MAVKNLMWCSNAISRSFSSAAVASGSPVPPASLRPKMMTDLPPAAAKVTTLSSGLTVATVNAPDNVDHIGFYARSGPAFEDSVSSGASIFLTRLLKKSNYSMTTFAVSRAMMGNHCKLDTKVVGRSLLGVTASGLPENLPHLVETISQMLMTPLFMAHELGHSKEVLAEEYKDYGRAQPLSILADVLHATAFRGTSLANPVLVPSYQIDYMPKSAIVNHWASTFTLENIVVAAHTTWAHEYLCEVLEHCEDLSVNKATGTVPKPSTKPGKYIGGEGSSWAWRNQMFRNHYTSTGNFFALAFEGAGASNAKEAAAFKVLAQAPSLAVAPSSAMHKAIDIFSHSYSDTGLFGLTVTASDEHSKDLLSMFVSALKAIASNGVSAADLERLVFKATCAVDMSRESVVDRLALAVVNGGCPIPHIADVSAADVKSAAIKALASVPTLVSYGTPPGLKRSDIGL